MDFEDKVENGLMALQSMYSAGSATFHSFALRIYADGFYIRVIRVFNLCLRNELVAVFPTWLATGTLLIIADPFLNVLRYKDLLINL